MRHGKTKAISDKKDGFTLVEVIVAAALITVSVIAVVAVVNTGSMLERSDNDRRQARVLIRSKFEQQYDFRNINTIPHDTTIFDSVVIDEREGTPLKGFVTTVIAAENITSNNNTAIPAIRIEMNCSWTETNGVGDSIKLTKILAKAQ